MKRDDKISGLLPIDAVTKKRGARVLGELMKRQARKKEDEAGDLSSIREVKKKRKPSILSELKKKEAKLQSEAAQLTQITLGCSKRRYLRDSSATFIRGTKTKQPNFENFQKKAESILKVVTATNKSLVGCNKTNPECESIASIVRIEGASKIKNLLKAFEERRDATASAKMGKRNVLTLKQIFELRKKNGLV